MYLYGGLVGRAPSTLGLTKNASAALEAENAAWSGLQKVAMSACCIDKSTDDWKTLVDLWKTKMKAVEKDLLCQQFKGKVDKSLVEGINNDYNSFLNFYRAAVSADFFEAIPDYLSNAEAQFFSQLDAWEKKRLAWATDLKKQVEYACGQVPASILVKTETNPAVTAAKAPGGLGIFDQFNVTIKNIGAVAAGIGVIYLITQAVRLIPSPAPKQATSPAPATGSGLQANRIRRRLNYF